MTLEAQLVTPNASGVKTDFLMSIIKVAVSFREELATPHASL